MIELILVVCSLLQPQQCAIERPAFDSPYGSMQSCMFQGQFAIVRWEEEHPNWQVRRWTCDVPKA